MASRPQFTYKSRKDVQRSGATAPDDGGANYETQIAKIGALLNMKFHCSPKNLGGDPKLHANYFKEISVLKKGRESSHFYLLGPTVWEILLGMPP
jgi:hypothetical protein